MAEQNYEELAKKYNKLVKKYNELGKNYNTLHGMCEKYKAEIQSKIVTLDLSNEDNRKTLKQLIEENKIVKDNKNREFILAYQNSNPIYEVNKVVHKIYIDEIKNITIKSYYQDYDLQKPENRTLIRQVIWCKHEGFNIYSSISNKDLVYLIDNNKIKEDIIWYSDVDCGTGASYYTHKGNVSLTEVKKIQERMNDNFETKKKALFDDDSKLSSHLIVQRDTKIEVPQEESKNVTEETSDTVENSEEIDLNDIEIS